MKKTGFTLSEVLITLGIIGVLAAMTIPTLIHDTQENETKTAVKAAYSILSSAVTRLAADNGGTITGLCTDFDSNCFRTALKPYLSYVKECDTNNTIAGGCWMATQYLDGTTRDNQDYAQGPSAAILKNGMAVSFRWHKGDCSNNTNDKCGYISVDVNGLKKPNRWGKDVFNFHIWNGILKPYGIDSTETCSPTETGTFSGWCCAYNYLYQ